MPLKGIPPIISPDLLYALARMGHGDELVLADANFPTSSVCAAGPQEIRAEGLDIPSLLEAILKFLPLERPVVTIGYFYDGRTYDAIFEKALGVKIIGEGELQHNFYARAKKSFAVVHTGDLNQYASIILKKGQA